MIILDRRKIRIFIFSVFVFALGITFITDRNNVVPTVSLPVSGKTVVIDAGHGKPDERC